MFRPGEGRDATRHAVKQLSKSFEAQQQAVADLEARLYDKAGMEDVEAMETLVADTRASLHSMQRAMQDAEEEYRRLETELSSTKKMSREHEEALRDETEELRAALGKMKEELRSRDLEIRSLVEQNASLRSDVTRLGELNQQQRQRLSEKDCEIEKLRMDITRAQKKTQRLEANVRDLKKKVTTLVAEKEGLDAWRIDMEDQMEQLRASGSQTMSSNRALEGQVQEKEGDLQALEERNCALQLERDLLFVGGSRVLPSLQSEGVGRINVCSHSQGKRLSTCRPPR